MVNNKRYTIKHVGARGGLHALSLSFANLWLCDCDQLNLSLPQIPHFQTRHPSTIIMGTEEMKRSLLHVTQQSVL